MVDRPAATNTDGVLARLAGLIDQLAGEDLSGNQGATILALDRLSARLDAQVSRRLGAFDQHLEHTSHGYKTAAAWLGAEARVASIDAHTRVRLARHCRQLDATRHAWQAGEISTRHVEVIVRCRHRADADQEFAEFEPALLRLATTADPKLTSGLCRRWRDALDADRQSDPGTDPNATEEHRQHERRRLHASQTLDGMVVLDGIFDPANGAMITTALEIAMDAERVADDLRNLPQLRADALALICEHYLSLRDRFGANRPHLIIQTDLATLQGRHYGQAQTEDGTPLSAETIRRLACDAIVQHVLTDRNIPLDLGRAFRSFTPAQHRAMGIRDRGCRYPGCDKAPAHCQGHHLQHWIDHGPTDLGNGALFCRCHHRFLHQGRYTVSRALDDEDLHALDFYDPNGNHIGRTYSRPPPTPIQLHPHAA